MCCQHGLIGVWLLLALHTCWGRAAASIKTDYELLLELKKSFRNGNLALAHWTGSDACSWVPNITCNDAGRVVNM